MAKPAFIDLEETAHISKIISDHENPNTGTERGQYMLERSIEKHGFRRSGVLDRHNRIVAGNQSVQRAAEMGMEVVRIIDAHPGEITLLRYKDFDLEDAATGAREYSYFDNRTHEVGYQLDGATLLYHALDIDVSEMYTPQELQKEAGLVLEEVDYSSYRPKELIPHACPNCGYLLD